MPKYIVLLLFLFSFTISGLAQNVASQNKEDSVMITVFLKHQQDKNLEEIMQIEEKNGFWEKFPPASARVVSWYVMMGIGQVVTVKIPASELRALNTSVENGAWGAFDTEFYPTYDFKEIWEKEFKQKRNE